MDIDLKRRTALVTGSTQGIGHAIATGLAAAGARVVVNGRGEDRVKDAVERLRAEVPDADVDGVAADVTTEEGTAALVAKLPQVDVLVTYLSSDLASATTGGALRVDGGYVDSILP